MFSILTPVSETWGRPVFGRINWNKSCARIDGAEQWGVKVFLTAAPAAEIKVASGRDYLRAGAPLSRAVREGGV